MMTLDIVVILATLTAAVASPSMVPWSCPSTDAVVQTTMELLNASRPNIDLENELVKALALQLSSPNSLAGISLSSFSEGVRVNVTTCNPNAGPVASYLMASAAQHIFKSGQLRWAAITVPPLTDADLRLYFHMMANISQSKVLVDSYKSNISKAEIWQFDDSTRLMLNNIVMSDSRDEHIYHEMLVIPALIAAKMPRNVLIIGGGEGASLREVLQDERVMHVTMVDLDGGLVKACQKHLTMMHRGSFESSRLTLLFDDGAKFLQDAHDGTFDVIIVDGIDFSDADDIRNFGTAAYGNVLFDSKFLRNVYRTLRQGGTFVEYMSHVNQKEYESSVHWAGFADTLSYCVDIASFHGHGACFSLSAKGQQEPLDARLELGLAENRRDSWLHLNAQVFAQCRAGVGRRLKSSGGGSGAAGAMPLWLTILLMAIPGSVFLCLLVFMARRCYQARKAAIGIEG